MSTPTTSVITTATNDEYDNHVNHEHTNHEHVARERERQAVGEPDGAADRNLGRENLRE